MLDIIKRVCRVIGNYYIHIVDKIQVKLMYYGFYNQCTYTYKNLRYLHIYAYKFKLLDRLFAVSKKKTFKKFMYKYLNIYICIIYT